MKLDEIDTGDGERHVTARRDSRVDEAVEQVDERIAHGSFANVYGGQGPEMRSSYPSASSSATAASNA